jgi:hypothetical protein
MLFPLQLMVFSHGAFRLRQAGAVPTAAGVWAVSDFLFRRSCSSGFFDAIATRARGFHTGSYLAELLF